MQTFSRPALITVLCLICNICVGEQIPSFAYCRNLNGFQEFAGRLRSNDELMFGLQIWNARGHVLGLYGFARKHGARWYYNSLTDKTGTAGPCRFTIRVFSTKRLEILPDPFATCRGYGGYGTELERMEFPPSSLVGGENGMLDNRGKFFEERDSRCDQYNSK